MSEGFSRIPVDKLDAGWVVDKDIYYGREVLVRAGVTVTENLKSSLRRRGVDEIRISDTSELVDMTSRPTIDPFTELLDSTKQIYETHGLETAIPDEVLEDATDQMEGFFGQMEMGQEVDLGEARTTVNTMVALFTKRSNLAIKLLDIDRFDRYTYRHSLNVGLLYLHVVSQWVENQEELEDLVYGAVLHDIGKAKVGSAIINKPGKLNDDEWETMRRHTVWSAELLEQAGASVTAVSIARSHHERVDGTGYPDRLKSGDMNKFVFLSTICDVYDALTTKRSYKYKMDFAKAIDIILQGCGTQFDPDVAHMFIRRVGRYPIGTFVELSDGRMAVVLRVNEKAISRPVISIVADANGTPYDARDEIDLSENHQLFIKRIIVKKEMIEPAT